MATPIPASLPPLELHDRILAALLPRLHVPTTSALRPALQILAYRSLRQLDDSIPTFALQSALSLSNTDELDASLLADLIWAYPNHSNAISTILTRRFDAQPALVEEFGTIVLPSLLDLLGDKDSSPASVGVGVRALSTLMRAHDDLLALGVMEMEKVISCLRGVYGRLTKSDTGLTVKEEVLLLVHRLVNASGNEEAVKGLMGPKERIGGGRAFIDGSLREDYEVIFGEGVIPDEVMLKLKRFQDERASLGNLISLFPYIPSEMFTTALNHPTYGGSPQPLVEAILAGGFNLPSELRELRTLVAEHSGIEQAPSQGQGGASGSKKPYERRNIWQDEKLDISRLKIKDHSDDALASIGGAGIPNHLRDSIFRLVENQAIEAEEQERALAEARGDRRTRGHGPDHHDDHDQGQGSRPPRDRGHDTDLEGDDEDTSRVRVLGGGDNSGDEDAEGDKDKVVDKTRRPAKESTYDPDLQIKLELAYLTNPAIFDRDAATRRSEGRNKLKDRTGMDDGQLEGWRVMLERNPHKDAILGRHQVIPQDYQIYLPKAGRGRGGGRGGGRERTESQGTSTNGEGSEPGSSSGGRGGNKGSRGHSNAARTRGHDKKMSRMGAV